jgi:hypothetical protein
VAESLLEQHLKRIDNHRQSNNNHGSKQRKRWWNQGVFHPRCSILPARISVFEGVFVLVGTKEWYYRVGLGINLDGCIDAIDL